MSNLSSSLLSRWFQEVWNNGNEKLINELIDDDAIAHGLTDPDQKRGPEGFKSFYNDFRSQFSDIRVTVEDASSQDDIETAQCKVEATHINSGKRVEFTGTCKARIQNGKIMEAWNEFDFEKMNQQLA